MIGIHGMFTMSLVVLLVRGRLESFDRAQIEASNDLGASPLGTFVQVTLPQIAPAILAGFLLAFTFSFDDFIMAFFVAGSETTLPIYIFSSIRRGVTPEINAIGTMVMVASLTLLIIAQVLLRPGQSRARVNRSCRRQRCSRIVSRWSPPPDQGLAGRVLLLWLAKEPR